MSDLRTTLGASFIALAAQLITPGFSIRDLFVGGFLMLGILLLKKDTTHD